MKLNLSEKANILLEGYYKAMIDSLKSGNSVLTPYGESETVLIGFKVWSASGVQLVTQSFLKAPGANDLLVKLAAITLGDTTGEVELEDMVGKQCGIEVKHRYGNNSRVFVNVVDVCSADELVDDTVVEEQQTTEEDELSTFGDSGI